MADVTVHVAIEQLAEIASKPQARQQAQVRTFQEAVKRRWRDDIGAN